MMSSALLPFAVETRSLTYEGAISGLFGDVLQGWVWSRAEPDLRVVVEVFVDGAFVMALRADQFQPAPSPGDGFHGFAAVLRKGLLEGASTLAVRVANQGPWLHGSVRLPAEKPTVAAPMASQVWYTGGLQASGWAWDPNDPARHVGIIVREGARVLARAVADKPHPALVYRPTADHGFSIDIPWSLADGRPHELHVETDMGYDVSGSPITIQMAPEGMAGMLRRLWPGDLEDPALKLLLGVAADHDRRAPCTVGFDQYPAWFAAHQKAPPFRSDLHRPMCGILLFGEGSQVEEAASMASLSTQRHRAEFVVLARKPGEIWAAVRLLLDSGAKVIVPLQLGDTLAPHALDTALPHFGTSSAEVSPHLRFGAGQSADRPGPIDWLYADCDQTGPGDTRRNPWFKPAWDMELFLGADLCTPGAFWSAQTVRKAVELLRTAKASLPPGVHTLVAAIVAATAHADARIGHLPGILVHRRPDAAASPAHVPASPERRLAAQWLASMVAPGARVAHHPYLPGLQQVAWPLPATLPRICVIVPTRDKLELISACIDGLLDTDYPPGLLQIMVVDNQSTCADTINYLDGLARSKRITLLKYGKEFNYSAINNHAAERTDAEILCLLNNDAKPTDRAWLKEMLACLLRPGVGAVGAKLLWPNGMTQHAGVVLGINGLAAHIGNTWNEGDEGYLGFNQLARRVGAVTGACLMVARDLYWAVGGLDAVKFPVAFNDVDLCMKIARLGKDIVFTPRARLIHYESASRGKDDSTAKRARALREQALLYAAGDGVQQDTAYHPFLNHDWGAGPFAGLGMPGSANLSSERR